MKKAKSHKIQAKGFLVMKSDTISEKDISKIRDQFYASISNKYIVLYNTNCTPKFKIFQNKEEAVSWIGNFTMKHIDNRSDFWVDALVYGSIINSSILIDEDSNEG